ncbi:MAG: hypothetical protein IT513_15195 [Burkholderiales bacterium]|nr:hypothetical protein [Burkholderiales bacterium]
MTRNCPKVLFCTSEVPQSVNAGSMQLYRALSDYPGDRLMVLGPAPEKDAQRLSCRYETLELLTYRLACTRFRAWMSGLNAVNRVFEPQLGRSLALAREFAPEVVVTVMDKLSYFKHAWALALRLGVPLMTVTMDDPQTFETAHPLLEGAFRGFLRRMYADAAVSLGVSREMCAYLEDRFGRASEVLYFGPPEGIRPRAPAESASLKHGPGLTLGYAGSLGLGYREGLGTILASLEATRTRLLLYTRDQHALIEHPNVVNRGFLAPADLWPAVQAECDAVVQPYAFEGRMLQVYRTHFPTKLSEYCWAGMPMLVIGPEFATGVRWAQRHPEAGLHATSASPAALGPLLGRLRDDAQLRIRLSDAAARLAREQFEPAAIRRRFANFLRQAATGRRPAVQGAA